MQRLHDEIAKAVAADDVQQVYRNAALDAVVMGPKDCGEMLARETAKYRRIGIEAKIEKQ